MNVCVQQLVAQLIQIRLIDCQMVWEKRSKIVRRYRAIDSFRGEDVLPYFWFKTKEQIRRLLIDFLFPQILRTSQFTGDEVLLVGLDN